MDFKYNFNNIVTYDLTVTFAGGCVGFNLESQDLNGAKKYKRVIDHS